MNSIAMLTRCFQAQHIGGIWRDLTEEERRGLISVDTVTPGREYLAPLLNQMAHRPLDEEVVIKERAELGLKD